MRLHYMDQQIKTELETWIIAIEKSREIKRGECCFISSLFCDNFHFVEALWSNLIVINPNTYHDCIMTKTDWSLNLEFTVPILWVRNVNIKFHFCLCGLYWDTMVHDTDQWESMIEFITSPHQNSLLKFQKAQALRNCYPIFKLTEKLIIIELCITCTELGSVPSFCKLHLYMWKYLAALKIPAVLAMQAGN